MTQSCGLRVIVNGYPKSGKTWITRLVADVIGCPVGGFWGAPNHKELAIEGLERDSPHRVYKGHHRADQFDELDSNTKIIYLLRDPRDVACSGANYFPLKKFHDNNPNLSHYDKYQAMVDVMLKGGVYSWCQCSWGEHVEGFFDIYPEVLIVKYENFLKDPVSEISKVLNYLDLDRSHDQIVSSVKNQSFNRSKAIEDKRAKWRGSFFRKGKAGSYKEELNKNLVSDINNSFWHLMVKLGYLNDDIFEDSVKDILLETIKVMQPKPSPCELIRIGPNKDGAYLLPDDLEGIKACFSPGTNNFKDFEDALLEKYNIHSHMCDFSSNVEKFRTPMKPGQTFKKKWLDVNGSNDSISLEDWVNELEPDVSEDLLLQMDIEGAEYRNLLNTPEYILKRFRIIVIELHQLGVCKSSGEFNKELGPLLELLDNHFICVHAHPNNCCGDFILPGSNLNIPNVHELTFLRRDRWEGVSDNDCHPPLLPNPLDIDANVKKKPPLFLNEYWLDSGVRSPESTMKILSAQVAYYSYALKQEKTNPDSLPKLVFELQSLAQHIAALLPEVRPRPSSHELVDLAVGKLFTLSSKHDACPNNERITEERPFFFHTGKGRNQYITIDLESEHRVFELHIKNRTNVCLERARCLFYCVHDSPEPDLSRGFPVSIDKAFLTKTGHISKTNLRGIKTRYLTIFSPEETFLHFSAVCVLGLNEA